MDQVLNVAEEVEVSVVASNLAKLVKISVDYDVMHPQIKVVNKNVLKSNCTEMLSHASW